VAALLECIGQQHRSHGKKTEGREAIHAWHDA
jgi:hypothetical protein